MYIHTYVGMVSLMIVSEGLWEGGKCEGCRVGDGCEVMV